MNPLHALDLLASEANALFETYLGVGSSISPEVMTLLPAGAPAAFRSVLMDAPAREEQLAVFREVDGSDWSDSDEG
jgi:H+/gluconate symporter-like permease